MTSPEEHRTLTSVTELLTRDLTTVPTEELAEGVRQIRSIAGRGGRDGSAQEWSGRLIAELRRRKVPWPEIERTTGIATGTAHRWAAPYMSPAE